MNKRLEHMDSNPDCADEKTKAGKPHTKAGLRANPSVFSPGYHTVSLLVVRGCLDLCKSLLRSGASLVAQMVKNLPTMQQTQVWSLGQEDPLEKRMAIHSSLLAWRIP